MDRTTSQDTQEFLSGVADQMEIQADQLESGNHAATDEASPSSGWHFDSKFGSKIVYTACYTLSYGICYPIFLACKYVPQNNEFVHGLVDGGASANQAVDEMMERAKSWRLERREAAERAEAESEVVASGAEALAPT